MSCLPGKIPFVLGLAVLLAACRSAPLDSGTSRYSIEQDRAPTELIDPASIPEVVPEPVTRTMAGNYSPYTVLGKTYHVIPSELGYRETGIASWYGEKFHGHRTSNGEIFDMYKLSAAHRSLPLPAFLKVTNLDNNRSIVVRVNDRGPFHGNRIVDLSWAAAVKLGYVDQGTVRVALEAIVPVGTETVPGSGVIAARRQGPGQARATRQENSYLQVGAFAQIERARELSGRLRSITDRPVFIRDVNTDSGGVLHRVRVGPVDDPGELRQLTQSVVAAGLGRPYTVTE